MKKLLFIVLFATALVADNLEVLHSFNDAVAQSKKRHKPIMMLYSAIWCPECNYMKEVVFQDSAVQSYLREHFIVLALDTQKDTLPQGFDYDGIPTFFFFTPGQKAVQKIIGGSKAPDFLNQLKAIQ